MTGQRKKSPRTELRHGTGVRAAPRQLARAYYRAPIYRVAHACFDCRKSFKLAYDPMTESEAECRCPGCGGALKWMGRTFSAPKTADLEQWKKVETLWNAGFRFESFRSFPEAEPLPTGLAEAEDFIARNADHPMRVR